MRFRAKACIIRLYCHLLGMWRFLNSCLFSINRAFQIGSALCGAAQNMTWLIVCRAVQGIGGGGIIQLVQITISDIVVLRECVVL